jgi:hypothetical protein
MLIPIRRRRDEQLDGAVRLWAGGGGPAAVLFADQGDAALFRLLWC